MDLLTTWQQTSNSVLLDCTDVLILNHPTMKELFIGVSYVDVSQKSNNDDVLLVNS